MAEVVKLQAVARLDPEAERQLAVWRDDLGEGAIDEPEESRARLEQHAAGRAVIVRLDVSAGVSDGRRLSMHDGLQIPGVWFRVDDPEGNERHAREMVVEELGRILAELDRKGIAAGGAGERTLPVDVVLDAGVQRALGSAPPSESSGCS